jgi:hypothetical protein
MTEEHLKIIETKDGLTVDELQELKKLAAMSKTARTIIAIVIGGLMLVGGDKLIEMIQAHSQVAS